MRDPYAVDSAINIDMDSSNADQNRGGENQMYDINLDSNNQWIWHI
jgi:hypothetical protein